MKIYSIWSVTHFIAFGFLWAVPVIFIGLTNMWISRLPNELQILFHLSSLFIDRTESWYENYIQIRTADTSDWVTVRSADYDPLEIFGAGNRITRMLAESSGNGNRGTALRGRIAEFIASKHAMVFPGTSPITEIRFVAAQWPVGSSEFMARPPGRWLAPPLELLPKDQLEVMSSHALAPVAHGSETPVVGGKWLTDTTLTAVLKSRKVIALDLSEATISSKGLQEVFAHPSVQTLNLSAHKLTPADFSGLSKLSALRELDLTDTATSAQGLQELASLTSLKVLKLSRNSLDGTIFNTLGKMKELEVLHLNYCGSGGQALQSIASWPKLRELQIAGAPEV